MNMELKCITKKMLPAELEEKGYRKVPSEALACMTHIFHYVLQIAVRKA